MKHFSFSHRLESEARLLRFGAEAPSLPEGKDGRYPVNDADAKGSQDDQSADKKTAEAKGGPVDPAKKAEGASKDAGKDAPAELKKAAEAKGIRIESTKPEDLKKTVNAAVEQADGRLRNNLAKLQTGVKGVERVLKLATGKAKDKESINENTQEAEMAKELQDAFAILSDPKAEAGDKFGAAISILTTLIDAYEGGDQLKDKAHSGLNVKDSKDPKKESAEYAEKLKMAEVELKGLKPGTEEHQKKAGEVHDLQLAVADLTAEVARREGVAKELTQLCKDAGLANVKVSVKADRMVIDAGADFAALTGRLDGLDLMKKTLITSALDMKIDNIAKTVNLSSAAVAGRFKAMKGQIETLLKKTDAPAKKEK